jgi:hypothetical protein
MCVFKECERAELEHLTSAYCVYIQPALDQHARPHAGGTAYPAGVFLVACLQCIGSRCVRNVNCLIRRCPWMGVIVCTHVLPTSKRLLCGARANRQPKPRPPAAYSWLMCSSATPGGMQITPSSSSCGTCWTSWDKLGIGLQAFLDEPSLRMGEDGRPEMAE